MAELHFESKEVEEYYRKERRVPGGGTPLPLGFPEGHHERGRGQLCKGRQKHSVLLISFITQKSFQPSAPEALFLSKVKLASPRFPHPGRQFSFSIIICTADHSSCRL